MRSSQRRARKGGPVLGGNFRSRFSRRSRVPVSSHRTSKRSEDRALRRRIDLSHVLRVGALFADWRLGVRRGAPRVHAARSPSLSPQVDTPPNTPLENSLPQVNNPFSCTRCCGMRGRPPCALTCADLIKHAEESF